MSSLEYTTGARHVASQSPGALVDRLYDWLEQRGRAAGGRPFVAGIRSIAQALGCSAGNMPRLLRQLESWGFIRRQQVGKYQRIEVVALQVVEGAPAVEAQLLDQAPAELAELIDQSAARGIDRSATDQALGRDPDRSTAAGGIDRSALHVRYLDSCMQQQQQQGGAQIVDQVEQGAPAPMVAPAAWSHILRGSPGYSEVDLQADLQALLGRGYSPASAIAIVVRARGAGAPIYGAAQVAQRAESYAAEQAQQGHGGNNENSSIPAPRPAARRPAAADRPRRPAAAPAASHLPPGCGFPSWLVEACASDAGSA